MFELSTIVIHGPANIRAIKGKERARTHAMAAATDFLAKCPGVPVKVLIKLA